MQWLVNNRKKMRIDLLGFTLIILHTYTVANCKIAICYATKNSLLVCQLCVKNTFVQIFYVTPAEFPKYRFQFVLMYSYAGTHSKLLRWPAYQGVLYDVYHFGMNWINRRSIQLKLPSPLYLCTHAPSFISLSRTTSYLPEIILPYHLSFRIFKLHAYFYQAAAKAFWKLNRWNWEKFVD